MHVDIDLLLLVPEVVEIRMHGTRAHTLREIFSPSSTSAEPGQFQQRDPRAGNNAVVAFSRGAWAEAGAVPARILCID